MSRVGAALKVQRAWRKKKVNKARQANAMVIAGNETRSIMFSVADGQTIAHNNFINLETSLFSLSPDIITNEGGSSQWKKGVIGNRYFCKGVSFRFMLENPTDRAHVIYRFMVIRASHGNVPNRANLFEGLSGNKMLDYVDNDRFTVEYQKWINVKAPNFAAAGPPSALTGVTSGPPDRFTNPKKLVKIYWPCKKHIRLQDYSDRETIDGIANRQRQKDFDYFVIIYGYDTFATLQDTNTVGFVNDYVSKMYTRDY